VIQIAVSRGKQLSHLSQIVYRRPPCKAVAAEARLITDSIVYTR
jgi:hypothetical protein